MGAVTLDLSWLHQKKTRTQLVQTGYEDTTKQLVMNGNAVAYYADDTDAKNFDQSQASYLLILDVSKKMVENSLRFNWGDKTYFDKNGILYCDLNELTGEATQAGVVNYATAKVSISVAPTNPNSPYTIQNLTSQDMVDAIAQASFITAQNPVAEGSLSLIATSLDGQTITGQSQPNGNIVGDIQGFVDYLSGFVSLQFGKWVDFDAKYISEPWYNPVQNSLGQIYKPTPIIAKSLRYNATTYRYIPVPNDIINIDTVRLPIDGQVPIFRVGDTVLISNTIEQDLGSAFTSGQTIQLDRTDLDRLCLQDSRGKAVLASLWEYDLNAGTITFSDSLDLSGYTLPLIAKLTYEEKNVIISTDIDGTLGLRFATKRDYPKDNTYVSSVLIGKDLQVRVSVPFTQRAWTNVWADTPIGDELLSRLNVKDYPIKLTDDGAITERWVIRFKSSSQFELYGQNLGFVGVFDLLTDLAPINPATNKPYFTIPKQAFGVQNGMSAWATQDVIRFNTWGTLLPFWVIQAVQPTANPLNEEDGFSMGVFGDTTAV